MRVIRFLTAMSLSVGLVVAAAPGRADTICVNPNNDSCESTIQDGIDLAEPNDTVNISGGTYYENVVIPANKQGLTVKGGSSAILDPDHRLGNCSIVLLTRCNVTADCPALNTCVNTGGGGGIEIGSNDVTLQGFTIRNGDDGIRINDSVTGTIVKNMTITGVDDDCVESEEQGNDGTLVSQIKCSGDDGIDITGNNVEVSNSRFTNLEGTAVEIDGNAAVVERNRCDLVETCVEVDGTNAEVVNNSANNSTRYVVDVDGDGALITRNQGSVVGAGIYVSGQNPVVESNSLKSLGENDSGIHVTCTVDCDEGRISKNSVKGSNYDDEGIYVSSSAAGLIVEKNTVENIQDDDGIEVATGSRSVEVLNNRVKSVGDDCLDINGASDVAFGHQIENNNLSGCLDTGIDLDSSADGSDLTKNRVTDSGDHAFEIHASGSTLTKNSAQNSNGVGFALIIGADNNILTDNKATKVRAAACNQGTGNLFTDNNFDAPTGFGLYCPSL